jgi:hypothetical protein
MRQRDVNFGLREIHPLWWVGLGMVLGAAGFSLFDPRGGAARRAKLRDKARSRGRDMVEEVHRRALDLKWRARGAIHEAKARLQEKGVPDDILEERIRSQIGRPVSHPSALHVKAWNGCVELSGPVLAREVAQLLTTVRRVRGVKEVLNHLQVHQTPEKVPGLQGLGSRQIH